MDHLHASSSSSSSLDPSKFTIQGRRSGSREIPIASERTGDDRLHPDQIEFEIDEDRQRSCADHRTEHISSSNSPPPPSPLHLHSVFSLSDVSP